MSDDKIYLLVIDPGLHHAAGHHFGFVSNLRRVLAKSNKKIEVDYLAHKMVDKTVLSLNLEEHLTVIPFFEIEFYKYYSSVPSLSEANCFISDLALEYRRALVNYAATDTMVLYPSLRWEHAGALAHALRGITFSHEVRHLACLMFSPGLNYNGELLNTRLYLNSLHSYSMLRDRDSVRLFASDWELSQKFKILLDLEQPLPVHPCYLDDWDRKFDRKRRTTSGSNTCLYVGDAKVDKGFLELPEILQRLLSKIPKSSTVTIQYTYNGGMLAFNRAVERLWVVAKQDSRVRIVDRHWSDAELKENLCKFDYLLFTHSAAEYQEKSSGFLWLACWYDCKVLTLEESWINREARRLGIDCFTGNIEYISGIITQGYKSPCVSQGHYGVNRYAKLLFRPILPWLMDQCRERTEGLIV